VRVVTTILIWVTQGIQSFRIHVFLGRLGSQIRQVNNDCQKVSRVGGDGAQTSCVEVGGRVFVVGLPLDGDTLGALDMGN
jgi:hypothetical protein